MNGWRVLGHCALGVGLSALLTACGAPPKPAPAPTPPPVPIAPPPATKPIAPASTVLPEPAPPVETDAGDPKAIERRAAAQAKAIEELLAARNAASGDASPTTESSPDAGAPPVPIERPKPPAAEQPPAIAEVPVPAAPPADDATKVAPNTAIDLSTPQAASPRAPKPVEGPVVPGKSGFEQRIADNAARNPRDVTAQLDQQLLALLHGESVPTPETYPSLQPDDREMLTTLLDGLQNFRAGVSSDPNMLMTRKIRPLTDMADRLRSEADLTLTNANVCSKVTGFGVYTPIDPPKFVAGRAKQIAVYFEVQNFVSKPNEKGEYVVNFHQDLVLYTESGAAVKTLLSQNTVDISRSRRHDYFLAAAVELPASLSTGRHMIKVTVVDQNAGPPAHVAETPIMLTIVAP